ncbi:variant erythrocyte surface antigen-1, alpha subunit [Babesia caballi]|uniref:Variant erythrocyte surface antigen-1, alpha subunit n=1 Tax=Babesia caballi TaxID=5871 RepID=A0AAV4LY53_BABCB|nr:variant erythrocyte surface antigen-1, alpha subunit [Babesia caballi]
MGGWSDLNFSGNGISSTPGGNPADLRDLMVGLSYSSKELNTGMMGSRMFASSASNFRDLTEGLLAGQASFPKFLNELHARGKENSNPSTTTHSLSGLNYIAKLYFGGRQSQKSKGAEVSPTTIREMLYFLAALPYSTVYDEFDNFITDQFKTLLKKPEESNDDNLKLDVADSSKFSSGGNDTLSAAELKQYLHTSCSFSVIVLGRFQGHGTAENDSDDPWLHKLFCNSEFAFNFPAAPFFS